MCTFGYLFRVQCSALLSYHGEIKWNEEKILIKISKNEAEYLRENNRGCDIHISSKTHKGKAKRYYLTTDRKSMYLLNEYRKSTRQCSWCFTERKSKI